VVLNTAGVNGGQAGTPKWIYRVSASYDSDAFGITAIGRGVSAGKYVANGIECQTDCPVSTVNAPTYERNRVSGAFYVDLNMTTKFNALGRGDGSSSSTSPTCSTPIRSSFRRPVSRRTAPIAICWGAPSVSECVFV
jgi:hypothetical protein